ncbi:hypothetical protein B0H10DRAFT_1955278 [Mycena sp. CBHHK59/15]|nr:hypothetical protein B0H10DRAFT_1955278 [Mycena sp. CBHHK59/15]
MRRGFLKPRNTRKAPAIPSEPQVAPPLPTTCPLPPGTPEPPATDSAEMIDQSDDAPEDGPSLPRDAYYEKLKTPAGNEPPLNPHRPPQWVLDSHHTEGETRFIFRRWTRDPKGETIHEFPRGKEAPNGIPQWGATLWDFYSFERLPGAFGLLSFSSGSRLANKMREIGELEAAADDIEWADREAEPAQFLLPIEIDKDIQSAEEVAIGFGNSRSLIVHDPWNLLSMPDELEVDKDTDWTQLPDIIRTYETKPPTKAGLLKAEHQKEVFRHGINQDDFILLYTNDGPCPPLLRIKCPPYPHKESTPAAHLYISPAHKAGVGNHSVVYNAEWELPRSLLVRDVFCHECLVAEISAMEASGELDKLIEDALKERDDITSVDEAGHVTGRVGVCPEIVTDVSKRTLINASEEDKAGPPDIRIVQPRTMVGETTYTGPIIDIQSKVKWQSPGHRTNCEHLRRKGGPFGMHKVACPPTTTVRVCAKLSIQYDTHLEREAKVYQALPSHLSEHWSGYNLVPPSREPVPVGAVVPQFYGYYVPTREGKQPARESDQSEGEGDQPAGEGEQPAEEGKQPTAEGEQPVHYLSPIMLLEDCGKPLDPTVLSQDDKRECWSLLYRLHHAQWVHWSVAERNIMVQPGPLTSPQGWQRGLPGDPVSFRLIDFGRSLYCAERSEDAEDVFEELREKGNLLKKMHTEKDEIDKLLSQGIELPTARPRVKHRAPALADVLTTHKTAYRRVTLRGRTVHTSRLQRITGNGPDRAHQEVY